MKLKAFTSLAAWLLMVVSATSASASPLVYVVTGTQQFGTVDLANGHFTPIGTGTPDALSNLVWWNGNLLTLTISGPNVGSLARINPRTGEETIIGPTGLGFNAFDLGSFGGKLYLTDFSNNIYSVDPATGIATPITATGMPPDPTVPFTFNSDGTFNLCDEGLYTMNGTLYATFDSFDLNIAPTPPVVAHVHVAPALYRIDASTGIATYIAKTELNISALVEVNGVSYAFKAVPDGFDFTYDFPIAHAQLLSLNLMNGKTTKLTDVDHGAGIILGATPAGR